MKSLAYYSLILTLKHDSVIYTDSCHQNIALHLVTDMFHCKHRNDPNMSIL